MFSFQYPAFAVEVVADSRGSPLDTGHRDALGPAEDRPVLNWVMSCTIMSHPGPSDHSPAVIEGLWIFMQLDRILCGSYKWIVPARGSTGSSLEPFVQPQRRFDRGGKWARQIGSPGPETRCPGIRGMRMPRLMVKSSPIEPNGRLGHHVDPALVAAPREKLAEQTQREASLARSTGRSPRRRRGSALTRN